MAHRPNRPGPQLIPEQIAALKAYAADHGRAWKSSLRAAWETGRYPKGADAQALQSVRNVFGPKWLTRLNRNAIT